jgi:hypothetical protein
MSDETAVTGEGHVEGSGNATGGTTGSPETPRNTDHVVTDHVVTGHDPVGPASAPVHRVEGYAVGIPDPRPPGEIPGAWPAHKEPRPVDPAEVAWWKAHSLPVV